MTDTAQQYDAVIQICKETFLRKMKDYGTSWRVLRPASLTDQIFIKAQRIRTLENTGVSKVKEGIVPEYIGIINYCIIALIQTELADQSGYSIPADEAEELYDKHFRQAKLLMTDKNHDYGEAWRDMRVSSFTDIILMRILRIRQIEDNDGTTLVSEGVESNYMDMINYSVFALIKLQAAAR